MQKKQLEALQANVAHWTSFAEKLNEEMAGLCLNLKLHLFLLFSPFVSGVPPKLIRISCFIVLVAFHES
jgi:hypothetical protein